MDRTTPGKQYKPDFIKEPSPELPFENLGGSWILKKPIQTSDFVDGKTGFKLDPQSSYSKIMAD